MDTDKLKKAVKRSVKSMWASFPILLGVILLASLAQALIPKGTISNFFPSIPAIDSIIGAGIGSILAGNPITSYIIGGELLTQGVSLTAITAFIIAWVTVGIVQLPAESMLLGKRFAIIRNATSFVFAVIIAYTTTLILRVLA